MKKVRLGVDMGGTRIKIGLVSDNGHLIKLEHFDAKSGMGIEERLEDLKVDISRMLGTEYTLGGVGIAFPGIIDSSRGKIISKYVKYPNAHKVNLSDWVQRNWQVPLIIENDARAALVGEWQYGAGQEKNNLLMVTLGTGMGTAVLIEGKLLRGKNFLAGNLGGHMSISFDGDLCNCGNVGCVETVGSTWALTSNFVKIRNYKDSALFGMEPLNYKKVFETAAQGDEVAKALKNQSLEVWATALINLLHAYDPEMVIMGGGIMESKDQILPFIKQRVEDRSWLPPGGVSIVSAKQKDYAGILGVCHLLNKN